jgi:AcrR family transcriptional regulator
VGIVKKPESSTANRPSVARDRILRTADNLFYNEGIHAVGIQRLVDEAGVTRVTLYRHFPSKDDLVSAYLQRRAQADRDQVAGIVAAHPGDARGALTELATALTRDDFGAVRRGCPFINAAAEFPLGHPVRLHAAGIRAWITTLVAELLAELHHRAPRATAEQLMMVRTGAVMSGALDDNDDLNQHFLQCWSLLIDAGLAVPA